MDRKTQIVCVVSIIALSFFVDGLIGQLNGDWIIHKFLLGKGRFIWNGFLSEFCDYVIKTSLVWCLVIYFSESKEVKIAAWLISILFIDFLIEGNFSWFNIRVFGYDFAMGMNAFIGLGYGLLGFKVLTQWLHEKFS